MIVVCELLGSLFLVRNLQVRDFGSRQDLPCGPGAGIKPKHRETILIR